jgi:hypothetical protein
MPWIAQDRLILPRHEGGVHGIGGVDHGAERIVLVRRELPNETRDLQWRKGFSSWSSVLEPKAYQAACLRLVTRRTGDITEYDRVLHVGSRLSRFMVDRHAAAIDAFFDVPVADQISIIKTLVWKD